MKKLMSPFLIVACICATLSCRKETVQVIEANQMSAVSEDQAKSKDETKFGVLVNALSGDDRITVAKSLKVNYVRQAIILKTFNGNAPLMDKYKRNGFKVLLNLNYKNVDKNGKGQNVAGPFPTNMTEYKNLLKKVLDKYTPEIAVIENEPFNDSRYHNKMEEYFTQLQTAIDVCKQYGVKVADGGLKGERICILTYRDYVSRGMQAKADDFGKRALSDKNLRLAQGKGGKDAEDKVQETKKMIEKYKKMNGLDYVNVHWYEPFGDIDKKYKYQSAPGVLKEAADYLRKATGKELISNEFGQTNDSPDLVKSLVDAFRNAGFKYAVNFSGDGKFKAVALNKGTKLKPNGEAYRDEVNKKK